MHTNTQSGRDCTKRALEWRAWKWKKPKSGMHFFELFLGIIKLIFEDLKY